MASNQNEIMLRNLNALRMNRRRVLGGVAASAIAVPTAGLLSGQGVAAAPHRAIRAQGILRVIGRRRAAGTTSEQGSQRYERNNGQPHMAPTLALALLAARPSAPPCDRPSMAA